MEEQNNFNEEQVKQEISDQVRAELNNLGYRILEQDQIGARDLTRLVNRFKNAKIDYDKECDRINNRYKEEVAQSKLKIVEEDFKYERQSLCEDIDKIIEQDKERRLAEAERLQADKDYKVEKKEAIEMLALLRGAGVEATDEIFMDMITPLIEAKDVKGLQVAKLLAGNATNEYIIEKATDNINAYFNNQELADFGSSAKEFINTGETSLSLTLYMHRFEQILRGGK